MMFLARILLALLLLVPSIAQAQFTDQRTWAPTTGGSANAQTVAIPNVSGPPLGVVFRFIPQFTNNAAATLNVNGTGAKNITKPTPAGPAALTGGELVATQIVEAMYDGTNYQLVSNLNASASQIVPTPQGYLTPCKLATPVTGCTAGNYFPTGDVTNATILYYENTVGNLVPIYNGSQFVPTPVTEAQMTLTLGSSHLANTAYDVCVFNNAGVPTIVTGPAWTTSTAGAGNRGTGAGTAQITRVNGLWTNAVQIQGINGASTYPNIPANQCTTVATIFIGTSNGVVSFTRTYGQDRRWDVFNFYNRQNIVQTLGDSTSTWSMTTTFPTFTVSNNNTANKVWVFTGLPEEPVTMSYSVYCDTQNTGRTMFVGILKNTSSSSTIFGNQFQAIVASSGWWRGNGMATAVQPPTLGLNQFYSAETNAVGMVCSGGQPNQQMIATWRG